MYTLSYGDTWQGRWWGILIKPMVISVSAAVTKSLQSCPTLCYPMDGSPPGSPVPGILQARTLEWVAISFSNAWKWKVKVKSVSRVWLIATHGLQPTRLLHPWDFPCKSTRVGCHCLLPSYLCHVLNSVEIWWLSSFRFSLCTFLPFLHF